MSHVVVDRATTYWFQNCNMDSLPDWDTFVGVPKTGKVHKDIIVVGVAASGIQQVAK
jgi:hypothetical protein